MHHLRLAIRRFGNFCFQKSKGKQVKLIYVGSSVELRRSASGAGRSYSIRDDSSLKREDVVRSSSTREDAGRLFLTRDDSGKSSSTKEEIRRVSSSKEDSVRSSSTREGRSTRDDTGQQTR